MEKSVNSFKMVFPSRSANEGFARTAVAAFVASLDPTMDELADVKTAVSEAVTNCIVHAYKNTIGLVYISAKLSRDGRLTVRVRDKGCGIEDVEKAMEAAFTTDRESERAGLGFSVMQSFMDSVRVKSACGRGTTVELRKKFAPMAGTAPAREKPAAADASDVGGQEDIA